MTLQTLQRTLTLGLSLLAGTYSLSGQTRPERPRLVVGMVVDQMCWDYLYRFQARYGSGGFSRLLSEGFNCHNTRIPYIPSVTAIGHSTVYTGSVPSIHGIAGNDFFVDGKRTYCTQDPTQMSVGAPNAPSGQMSPRNLLVTTITDELKLATQGRSKVVGIALKDRGAILPAGHSADAAYWFDDKSGRFITSTYYRQDLPQWLQTFNDGGKRVERLLQQPWAPLYPLDSYKESTADATNYEAPWDKDTPVTLPLDVAQLAKRHGYGVVRGLPHGNSLTLDLAKATLEGEAMGMHKGETDFLAISLSSTDYMGHRYGTDAIETEDMYLRLDRDLANFFTYLDKKYGKGEYIFFITADHAAAHNIGYLRDRKLPAGGFRSDLARKLADSVAREVLGSEISVVKTIHNYQVVLDEMKLDSIGANRQVLQDKLCHALSKMEGVAYAVPAERVAYATIPEEIRMRIINGYNHQRSGAIFIVPHPGWWSSRQGNQALGTSHGVWAPYDTHIPLIFMGKGIPAGHLYRETHMTDIAPSLAFLLSVQLPSGCIGKPITELWGGPNR